MSVLEALVGFIAPPDCLACGSEGSALCRYCSALYLKPFGERCWRCNRLSPASRTCESCRRVGGPASVFICTDYQGLAQQLVRKYKFGHLRAAAEPMAEIMVESLREILKSQPNYLVVPVPTATSRARQRGFGHSELLAKAVAAKLRLPCSNCLRRLDQTRQLGSARDARLTQLENSFAAKSPGRTKGRPILLIDDVLTTGGTLVAASKTLRAAGAVRVDALLFAKRL